MTCSATDQTLILNAKEITRVTYSLDADTSGYDVIFRLKKSVENTTTPLVEQGAIKLTETSTSSTGYFDIDLQTSPTLAALSGPYVYEIEMNDGSNPPIFYGKKPQRCLIQIRLDNN